MTGDERTSNKIKAKIREWSETTTSHGYPNIFRSSLYEIRIMWLIFTMIATGLCAYMIVKSVIDYLNFEINTKIVIDKEIPSEFPTITICNLNPFYKNMSIPVLSGIFGKNFTDLEDVSNDEFKIGLYKFLYLANHPSTSDEQKKKLGPSLSKMLIYCSFIETNCSLNDFSWKYLIDFGNCFRFNSGYDLSNKQIAIKKVYKEGVWSALHMELYIERSDLLTGYWFSNGGRLSNGIKVFIDNSSAYLANYADGIDVAPGTSTNIAIKRILNDKIPYPYSECQSEPFTHSDFYMKTVQRNVIYKQKDCVFYCLQKDIMKTCNCYDSWYQTFNESVPPCSTPEQINCADNHYFKIFSFGQNLDCSKECPQECSSISYEISSSSSQFPSRSYYTFLKRNPLILEHFNSQGIENVTYELLRERVIQLKIYFKELTITKVSEMEKTTMIDLLAIIGGQLGLFIGMSVLSFAEFFELTLSLLIILCNKKRGNKVSTNLNNNREAQF